VAVPFPELAAPIVQAPLAGGPSTPELAAAVAGAGGLGFLAAGYKAPEAVAEDIARLRGLTSAPFGVNLFCLTERPVDAAAVEQYARRLGADPGLARFEDDRFADKLELVLAERVPIVSFTFGCPPAAVADRLHAGGAIVWVTVTGVPEAEAAHAAGADALVVQGVEAGGHRGSFEDGAADVALLPLLRLVGRSVDLPLVASGGIADGAGVAAVLAAGAFAAQIGTGFLRCPEAATSAPHREALTRAAPTRVTRAFTGRRARGIVNRFLAEHDAEAPAAYPHVHHLTAPLRAAARSTGDAEAINLWAGQAYPLAEELPAAELVRRWTAEARAALESARARLPATS
jgi:nitronate monooxygenase